MTINLLNAAQYDAYDMVIDLKVNQVSSLLRSIRTAFLNERAVPLVSSWIIHRMYMDRQISKSNGSTWLWIGYSDP
jgi:hypothetical protein